MMPVMMAPRIDTVISVNSMSHRSRVDPLLDAGARISWGPEIGVSITRALSQGGQNPNEYPISELIVNAVN